MLDEDAFDSALADDADGALELLAAWSGPPTRSWPRRPGGWRRGWCSTSPVRGRPSTGVGRMELRPADRADGDLDLDASLEPLQLARAGGTIPPLDELRVSAWGKPSTAVCLVIDRSGSMSGTRLATAALATAACAWRAGADHSVVAFSDDVVVVKSQDVVRPPAEVADDVLRLRGMGPTDLAFALRVARDQLARSRAQRRVTILLSDCRPTTGSDPALAAVRLDELVVVAPADDSDDAAEFARSVRRPLDPPRRPLRHPRRLRPPARLMRDQSGALLVGPSLSVEARASATVSVVGSPRPRRGAIEVEDDRRRGVDRRRCRRGRGWCWTGRCGGSTRGGC